MSSSATADPRDARWLGSAAFEAWLLALLVGGFLAMYTGRYAAASTSILPHLGFVASFALAIACLRIALHRSLPSPRAGTLASAFLATTFFLVLALYYALVLAGLQSWGRVVTWRLIATYSTQAGDLLGVLGIAPVLAALVAFGVVLAMLAFAAWLFARQDWTRVAAGKGSSAMLAIACSAGLLLGAAQVAILATEPPVQSGEPFSLTFFPERAAPAAQNHLLLGNARAQAEDAAARKDYRPADATTRPNVIVIVADALRADHMQLFGYARETTPFLAQLDAGGSLQKAPEMRAVCGESSCGLMAIAKSAFVHQLTPASMSLVEVLKLHGYATRMILGGDHTNFYDLRTAYGAVDHYFDGSMAASRYMNDDRFVLEQTAALAPFDDTPVYLQFHLMSTHGGGERFLPPRFEPATNYYRIRPDPDSPAAAPEAVNYYDNGVRQFDHVVQALLATLEDSGYLRDAVVVVTADHGEMLGESGDIAHSRSVREGVLHVPFAMAGYGRTLRPFVDAQRLVSQADLAPTVLAELGFPAPRSWKGLALQAPRERGFLPFQQGLKVGAYDARSPGETWKYWRDLADGSEHLSVIRDGSETPATAADFGASRLALLRAESLAGTAGAIRIEAPP